MSLFVRTIELAKWQKSDFLDCGEIPADAITRCLKTNSDCLSVWEIGSEAEIEDAVLAIVSNHDHLEKIDIILLDPDYLLKSGIEAEQSDGITKFEALKKSHKNLLKLSYRTLGIIANHIVDNLKINRTIKFTKGHLKEMLKEATTEGRKFTFESLPENIQKALRS
jgi:hypothetical protein